MIFYPVDEIKLGTIVHTNIFNIFLIINESYLVRDAGTVPVRYNCINTLHQDQFFIIILFYVLWYGTYQVRYL